MDDPYRRLRDAARRLQEANEALDAAELEHRLAVEGVDDYERQSAEKRAHRASTNLK